MDPEMTSERAAMVRQLVAYKVTDERVLKAMGKVRRHMFIPEPFRNRNTAYGDYPWTIGHGQTISQPFIVAYMTERIAVKPGDRVLEVGTGSGYQAAILAELGARVFSIEIVPELAEHARKALASEGYGTNAVQVLTGDGYKGWPEHAPFDGILVTAAPERIPPPLLEQLASPGRMVIPVGGFYQELKVIERSGGGYTEKSVLPVRFVPFVRESPTPPPASAR
jgi:protein-L-isoaspartate(D-aspartate) O-methyltransferase